jgi:hypothetical protein
MESELEPSAQLTSEDFRVNRPTLVANGGEGAVSKTLWRVGRPVARAADGLRHNRDRYRHIKQFQHVTRVTLRTVQRDS